MGNGRGLGEVGIEHPINDERCIFVGSVFRTNDDRSQKISSVFISADNDRLCATMESIIGMEQDVGQTRKTAL